MASIAKRADGRWRARYRGPDGREHARHFDRKVDATRWVDEQTTATLTGTYADPRAGRVTVAEMAEAWMEGSPGWAESTRARNRASLTRHVLPRWGSTPVAKVTYEAVQTWVVELSASGLAGASVRKTAGALNSVLELAVRSKRIAVNPARGVDLPKASLHRRRYLAPEQVEALAAAADTHADIVLTLAYCGLRIGELAALRAGHVDVLRRRLRVEESVTEVNGRLVWSAPKDHQRRSVPFPVFLAEPMSRRLAGLGPEDLVFASSRGAALRVRTMRRGWFDAAATAAGVEGLTPHELRHTAASLAVSAGASVLAVARMLGHERPSMTLDVYSDLFDDDLDAVADRLGEVRAQIPADFLRTMTMEPAAMVREIGR